MKVLKSTSKDPPPKFGGGPTGQVIKELIKSRAKARFDLSSFKREMSKKYRIPCPTNIQLLKAYHELLKNKRVKKSNKIERLLITRPIRSLSGIANVSVLTKPYPCPGKCLYCPTEKGIPKSYLSGEPAVERAKKLNYDPYLQVQKRIEMLEAQGHPTDKIELRIIGGTWSFYDKKYQFWFIKRCFDACNGKKSSSLETGQKINETEKHRIIGLSIETRPDFIDGKEIIQMRELGITKVELGVQSIYNNILELNKRGHSIDATIKATKLLKDAGFKVSYQMMPNLPGSNPKKDVKMFKELFENSDFKPDLIKIYPCALVKEASLYKWYLKGKYKPYSEKKLITIIKEIKNKIPYYVRIERIIRDIPAQKIIAGPTKISNLREAILEEMKKEGRKCKCIRCREIRENYNPKERLYLFRENYEASGGKEIFLSFENKNRMRLYSLLRLRIPSYIYSPNNASIPTLRNSSIIREIHTYGQLIPIATKEMAAQHRGLGKKLVRKAEKITTREFNLNKIAVISAVGTRDYYRKLGYKLKDTYMIKKL
jgi:elongator complex protein 3